MLKQLFSPLCHRRLLLGRSVAAAILFGAACTHAQESDATDAQGQDAEATDMALHGITVVPRVSITQTFTDNVNLASTGAQAEQITEVSPGIHIASVAGRLKGHLDYALRAIGYAQSARADAFQNALDAVGQYEAIERLLYVDASGAISQQAITAFGTQSAAGSYSTVNRAEVSNYRLSPYLQGRLGDAASFVVRVTRLVAQSDSAAAPGTATLQSTLSVDGSNPNRNLGWLLDVSRTGVDYSAGRYTESDLSDVGLSYAFTPQLSLFVKAGIEANNYTSVDKQSYATNDVGLKWTPSERTRVSASQGNRSFGEAHAVSVEYGTAHVTLRVTDTRDVSTVPAPVASAINSFVVSALALQRRQELSLILRGARDTLTLVANRSESSRVDTLSTAIDDLARSAVQQIGSSFSYQHRLTPVFNLGFSAALQRASGAPGLPDSWLREMNVSVSGKVTRKSSVAMGLRHSSYTGALPYDESAIFLNLTVEF